MKRSYKNFFSLFAGFVVLFFVINGCKKDKPFEGFDMLIDPNSRGRVDSTVVNELALEVTFADTVVPTGASMFLELGVFKETKSTILMKFEDVPDSVDILSATLILDSNTLYSDGQNKTSFFAQVHPATTDWDEASVTFERFDNQFDPVSIAEAEFLTTGADLSFPDSLLTESTEFHFSEAGVELVKQWADSTKDNFGLYLRFDEASFAKEVFSSNNPINQPRLSLDVFDGTERDTITSAATADAFLLEQTSELPPGFLYMDKVFNNQSIIKFDFSQIPRESTINRATLLMNLNNANSIIKGTGAFISLTAIEAPFEPGMPVQFDNNSSVIFSNTILPESSEITFTLTGFVQFWVTEDLPNNGLLIRATSPGTDLARIALESNQTSSFLAPRLVVEYSVAPSSTQF